MAADTKGLGGGSAPLLIGTEQLQREFMGMLEPMKDAKGSFQTRHLSATSRLSRLLRKVPPFITPQAAAGYDALVEEGLAFVVVGEGAAATALPTPEKVVQDPSVWQNQPYLGHEALR